MKPPVGSNLLIADHVVAFYETKEAGTYDAEATQLAFLIRALAQRLNDVSSAWLEPFGLTALSLQVLTILQAEPGQSLSLSAITKSVHTRAATMTALIDGLERNGWIKRVAHATDRRATLAALTPKGKKLIAQASAAHHEHLKNVMAGVAPGDRRAAVTALLAISEGAMLEKARLRAE